MDYSFIIEDMLWSYSRLTSFEDCKYRWFLQYIQKKRSDEPKFFSTYGRFLHSIMEQYLSGKLGKEDLVPYYLENYDEEVIGDAPSQKIKDNFFKNALVYLQDCNFPYHDNIAVEKRVRFEIDGYKFIGFIDVLSRTGKSSLHITDHKSHGLMPRSGRRFPTKYDKELDDYLRQQYLYSIPVHDEYGQYPKTLNFNCYRHGRFITEPFDPIKLHEVKVWAVNLIDTIKNEKEWEPNPDQFKCNYICDMKGHCEHCPAMKRGAA